MTDKREGIMTELLSRMSSVPSVEWTDRNPEVPPSVENLPAIQLFEMGEDKVMKGFRNKFPEYECHLTVVIEAFIKGTEAGAETTELNTFIKDLRKKLYAGGATLGGRCLFVEKEVSRVLRPGLAERVIGLGIVIEIQYIEQTASLF
jgi:hypothetical protein